MFNRFTIEAKLDNEILVALDELESCRDNPEKYAATLERIGRLDKLKTRKGISPPSMDTVFIVGANIFGVLWVTRHEREHPIPKSLNFVMKAR